MVAYREGEQQLGLIYFQVFTIGNIPSRPFLTYKCLKHLAFRESFVLYAILFLSGSRTSREKKNLSRENDGEDLGSK